MMRSGEELIPTDEILVPRMKASSLFIQAEGE
jgi:hypothetical protein